jgi:outer membrane lipoprotein-sorting protein
VSGSWRRAVLILTICSASCAPRLTKLPTGAGTLAPDIAAVLVQALTSCQRVQSLTAEIAVNGSVGGQRIRARLIGGFTPSSMRLEAVAPFGAPLFTLVGTGNDGTLYLPRDQRVVEHGPPAEVMAAVAGVPLGANDMLRTLTGCAMPEPLDSPLAIGDNWRTSAGPGGAKIYLHRDSATAPWRLVTYLHGGDALHWTWRADYDDFHDGLPHVVRLVSADQRRFNLELKLSQIESNVQLKPEVFRVDVPPNADRISVEELKRSGLLGATKGRDQ